MHFPDNGTCAFYDGYCLSHIYNWIVIHGTGACINSCVHRTGGCNADRFRFVWREIIAADIAWGDFGVGIGGDCEYERREFITDRVSGAEDGGDFLTVVRIADILIEKCKRWTCEA